MPGTLEMLILKTLTRAPMHGYAITKSLREFSDDVLHVEEGSLYPALQRLEVKGWVVAEWRLSEKNRRARYYELTLAGREQLALEVDQFDRMVQAITRVLRTA
jgi:PadR family transcriptional regulator, regulatory protein PadR